MKSRSDLVILLLHHIEWVQWSANYAVVNGTFNSGDHHLGVITGIAKALDETVMIDDARELVMLRCRRKWFDLREAALEFERAWCRDTLEHFSWRGVEADAR